MEQICQSYLCTGCSACANVCPKDAITMVESGKLGHIAPFIDHERCIDCKLCEKTCPVNAPVELNEKPKEAIAAVAKSSETLATSASGGIGTILANTILKRGGVAYGCVQQDFKDIAHQRIDNLNDATKMAKSKYVQSHINLTYRRVKEDLLNQREVIFFGTPCQTAGLRAFLRKDYPQLYLVDLICHGVPSQKILRDSVYDLIACNKLPLKNYSVLFRRKSASMKHGSPTYGLFLCEDEKLLALPEKQTAIPHNGYINAFTAGLLYRDSCYVCPYSQPKRVSDITIGDYWGLPPCTIDVSRGVSLVLISTPKGQQLFDAISPDAIEKEVRPVDEAIACNGQLNHASSYPSHRKALEEEYPSALYAGEEKAQRPYSPVLYKYYRKHTKSFRWQHKMQTLHFALYDVLKQFSSLHRLYRKMKALCFK